MGMNLFPVRVAIGKVGAPDGRQLDVLMTPEFARALSDIQERVGGQDGISVTELQKLIKALQEQALQLVGQIKTLFDLADDLSEAIQDQALVGAITPDQVGPDHFDEIQLQLLGANISNLSARLYDSDLQQAMMQPAPALEQKLADVAMLLALQQAPKRQKNTVTGAKGGNAALTSLLTALDKSGYITDSTT